MYLQRFGLKHEPFSIAPDPRFLYMSERHREALAHLLYGLRGGGGFVLLTGDVGAGKTTVARCFLEQLPEGVEVAYIFNPRLTVLELLQTVCQEFGLEAGGGSVKALVDTLNTHLLATHAAGRASVLIIDEAQNLDADVLEQLRLLTNLETRERKLLQIVLIGQPELRALVAQPRMEQLAQRVIARYHLGPLEAADTRRYIAHRLAVAGWQGALPFSTGALARIQALAGGVPRRINLLCDRVLLALYARERREADRATVDAAAREVFDPPRPASPPRRWWLSAALGTLALAVLAGVGWRHWGAAGGEASTGQAAAQAAVAAASQAAAAAPAAAPASQAASAAVEPAPPPAPAVPPPPAPAVPPPPAPAVLPLAALLERAGWADEAPAWQALARRWQIDLDASDPCAALASVGLACHRQGTTLAQLRELDRPVLLALRPAAAGAGAVAGTTGAAPEWALLAALDASLARLQWADGQTTLVRTDALALRWTGQFATVWRRPPGVGATGRLDDDAAGRAWLRERLDALQPADAFAAHTPLRERVAAFQRAHGLRDDGVAGPMTLMQLNRAAGEPGPRLDPIDGG